jgi:serine/threonine-protein kinase RsbT
MSNLRTLHLQDHARDVEFHPPQPRRGRQPALQSPDAREQGGLRVADASVTPEPWPPPPFLVRHRVRVPVRGESDIALARQQAAELAAPVGLSTRAMEALATGVSEIAQDIVDHGRGGEITFAALEDGDRRGVTVTASGPGLGFGVASVRRLMDEFELISTPEGTTVNMAKWADAPPYRSAARVTDGPDPRWSSR